MNSARPGMKIACLNWMNGLSPREFISASDRLQFSALDRAVCMALKSIREVYWLSSE